MLKALEKKENRKIIYMKTLSNLLIQENATIIKKISTVTIQRHFYNPIILIKVDIPISVLINLSPSQVLYRTPS